MAHPYHHALSSVKKWGGTVDDFIAVHAWFDQSKEITADFRHRALRHHAEGFAVFALALALTSGSLLGVHSLVSPTPHWLELSVLITANLTATALRFTLMRGWVFPPNR